MKFAKDEVLVDAFQVNEEFFEKFRKKEKAGLPKWLNDIIYSRYRDDIQKSIEEKIYFKSSLNGCDKFFPLAVGDWIVRERGQIIRVYSDFDFKFIHKPAKEYHEDLVKLKNQAKANAIFEVCMILGEMEQKYIDEMKEVIEGKKEMSTQDKLLNYRTQEVFSNIRGKIIDETREKKYPHTIKLNRVKAWHKQGGSTYV